MNTINPVISYTNLRNNPQPPVSTTQQTPAFKGVIGNKVVKQIAAKEALTVAGIVGLAAGMIGLSKDKVTDIVESLVDNIKGLMGEKEELQKQNLELKKGLVNTKSERDFFEKTLNEKKDVLNMYDKELSKKVAEIEEKDAKIAELQKYEGMAKVKSVEDSDIITPERFVELIQETEESEAKAEESLLKFLFTGTGQEEFLAHIDKSNKIYKARKDGITKMPELKAAFNHKKACVGIDPVYVAQKLATNALQKSEKGAQIHYPKVRQILSDNLEAITAPMREKDDCNPTTEMVMDEILDFYTNLEKNKNNLIKKGYEFVGRKEFDNKPYYSFTNQRDGSKYDIFLDHLSNGFLGYYRTTSSDGKVICSISQWEVK